MFEQADLEGRELTGEERATVQRLLDDAQEIAATERQMDEIGRMLGPAGGKSLVMTDPRASFTGGGPGDVFIQSKGFRQIADPGHRPQVWSSGAVEVPPFEFQLKAYNTAPYQTKGTLLEGTAGSGAGLVPVPQVVPGVVTTPFEPISDPVLFSQVRRPPAAFGTSWKAPPPAPRPASRRPASSHSPRSGSTSLTSR
jgi:hypothetical protein